MKIGIVGSMQYAEKMIEIKNRLEKMGYAAYMSNLSSPFVGKSDEEKEKIKIEQKTTIDIFEEFWDLMQGGDAILVVNYDKHGIKNYIGGNTFLEMGFAKILKQEIFLLNPVPKIELYESEIIAMKPIIINGDLSKIK